MPVLPNQIRIAELDYDQILTNLVDFMKADPSFADYDFSGSGLRLISRVLAYVTFYQNYYLTTAVNEGFLDTAQLRTSVASHARMLGYGIHGVQSARFFANVAIELEDSSALTVTLPKHTQFTLSANQAFTFYNLNDEELTVNNDTELYEGTGVELVEGTPLTFRFTVDTTNPTQRFIIPNANIDYTTIEVQVQAAVSSNVVTTFLPANNFLTIDSVDPVFFVNEADGQFPELTFGNGVVGQALENGNIVIANYFVSRGSAANGIRGPFSIPEANVSGFVSGATEADSNTVSSVGGSDSETLDSARFLAPLVYQTQNRAVTAEDYKAIILQALGSSLGAINVFGGEQGDPSDPQNRPQFGKVFIVIKPTTGLRFTDSVRTNIEENILKPKCIVGVIPEVIDPDYIYLNVSTSVRYDPKATTRTKLQLMQAISNSIVTYAEANIEKFDTSFRYSRFVRVIDDTDEAILSSVTRVDLEKRVFPSLGESNQYVLKYNSPLRKNSDDSVVLEATSHRFTYVNDSGVTQDNCFLFEQGGILSVAFRNTSGAIEIFQSSIGTVDADRGLITVSNFIPTAIENDEIDVRIRVVPAVNDFTPELNQLFTIDEDEGISVQLLNDATASQSDVSAFFVGGILP